MKRAVRENVRALIEKTGGKLKPGQSGVTRLLKLGISNGNAQRLLDEESTVSFETLEKVADAFKVNPWDLVTPGMSMSTIPFRDLDVFEAQLVTMYRQLSHDRQHEVLIDLSDEVNHGSEVASAQNPFAGVERRSAMRFENKAPANLPERRKHK